MRFSKAKLLQLLMIKIDAIEQNGVKFDYDDGYAQVTGRGEKVNRLYGEWVTLQDLRSQIEWKEI